MVYNTVSVLAPPHSSRENTHSAQRDNGYPVIVSLYGWIASTITEADSQRVALHMESPEVVATMAPGWAGKRLQSGLSGLPVFFLCLLTMVVE